MNYNNLIDIYGFVNIPVENGIDLKNEIIRLKKEKNVLLLVHYYQYGEIQDLADCLGDSLALAQFAEKTEADVIAFAGVHFMAETAKILNPAKKVILPDITAGCSLAESCAPEKFREFLMKNSGHTVISYINCTAEIKAMSDIICTSSNAVKIVNSLPETEKIIFGPDKNLGRYINQVTGRNMLLWDGSCMVHEVFSIEKIIKLKLQHTDALLLAHPECKQPVLEIADYIGSTTALLNYSMKSKAKKFIVATETGILHQMKKNSPEKEFIVAPVDESECGCADCIYMKKNTLEKLYLCLKYELPEIKLPVDLMNQARKPIQKMLELSKN